MTPPVSSGRIPVIVNVFDLDRALVGDYERFARSFTQIRAPDILSQVEAIYATNRFWPEPLISINPHFEQGASVEQLAREGSLHPDTARIFRVDGHRLSGSLESRSGAVFTE
jgi:hypothetical protein